MMRATWVTVALTVLTVLGGPRAARATCAAPGNAIEAENCLAGVPQATWDISGSGDATIQGFATDISVNKGTSISFKVQTTASAYRLDIYRMGYYGGNGARQVATVNPSATLPQPQPACITDSTGLIDCGNWPVSATWAVPANAVSGIYFARVIRTDTQGASHIFFVVRDDANPSAILFQTADSTWQAYNDYGGNSFYKGNGAVGRAYKVSYNRPLNTRVAETESFVFNGEYPMVRWLEANGYDVTYHTGVDADRYGGLIKNHKLWISNGHDEYWSGAQRANVEAARDAKVNLAFLSGNTAFWKTRWENSIDGSGAAYRTLVCYKETHANAVLDPLDPPTWTGTWRDPRFSPPADGGRPENALTGLLFRVNGPYTDAITVPQADGKMRIWRNTSVASLGAGQVATLAPGTLGAEVNVDEDNGFRPSGLFGVSNNAVSTPNNWLLDYGSTYGAGSGTARVTLYKHSSGALVFATGSYQWSWGLDSNHDRSNLGAVTDVRMQQASVNLLADMGIQPMTLQAGLTPAVSSADSIAPTSLITAPASGATLQPGVTITIAGTAADSGGGVVGGVEVSLDGGTTWHPASGRESWSLAWTPSTAGSVNVRSRAVDDSGNLEVAGTGVTVTVATSTSTSIWPSAVPVIVDGGPDGASELGVKFKSDVSAWVTGIRFYKASANTGTHAGSLWTSTGTRLATATFVGESVSGWQQVLFSSPVAISANTVYVASYSCETGHYASDQFYFTTKATDSPPLHALASGVAGPNGVYVYGAASTFPSLGFNDTNYWVDVVLKTTALTLSTIAVTPATPTIAVGATQQFVATGTYSDATTQDLTGQVTWTSSNGVAAAISSGGLATGASAGSTTIQAAQGAVTGNTVLTVQAAPLVIATMSLPGGTVNSAYSATLTASGGKPPYSWTVTPGLPPGLSLAAGTGAITGTPTAAGSYNLTAQVTDPTLATASRPLSIVITAAPSDVSIWPSTAVPAVIDPGPDSPVELGVRFKSDRDGTVKGIRFYKASANTGTHVGNLWSSTGTRLATATFGGETASGWQQVLFATPAAITANTVYVASYHSTIGHYSVDSQYFAASGVDSPPLHALADGVSGGDGLYSYGTGSLFPNQTFQSDNYWVDVVFTPKATSPLTSIAVTPASSTITAGATQQFVATGTYGDGTTQALTTQVVWASSSTATATITAGGLASGLASGNTTISATQGGISGSTPLTVQVPPLSIATASLPVGTQYQTYSAALAANGGNPPYDWSVSPALPTGLSLNVSTGAISGRPSAPNITNLTVTVKDANLTTVSKALTLTVNAAPLTITSTSLPAATQGLPYSTTLTASGGLTPYTWSILTSALPPGLSLNAGSGVISGTPTALGSYTFATTLTDSVPQTASANLTIGVSASSNYSLWPNTSIPVNADSGPDSSVELGLAFTSDSAGFITGIRYYKSSANTGTHSGSLWTSTGTLLATATFTGETAAGWQQVSFAKPVGIIANTTYVASYHCSAGHYAGDVNFFGASGVDNPPLHAPASGNGLYSYGASTIFPSSTYIGSNYWVDVVLNPTSPPPALTSIAVTPAAPSMVLGGGQQFTATATYSNGTTAEVTSRATWASSSNTIAPVNGTGGASALGAGKATITATVNGFSGNGVLTVTPPPPPPNEGPGGPILVVSAAGNPFGRYLAEILRAEGFNEFLATDISNVTASTLTGYDLVMLGDQPLTASQVGMFTNWVNGGGRLIAMHPDKQLAGLLGLIDRNAVLSESYLLAAPTGPGAGIVSQSMQFHGSADLYATSGASMVATLYSGPNTPTTSPAVTLNNAGLGQAAAFTYDLARSVVYTRQGNPLWSGQKRDGHTQMRADDLFFGGATFDPQLDWIDFNKVQIPQADEQQRLLANLILQMNQKPLPRFWYLPNGFRAVVVMTGDDHANGGTAGRFNDYLSASPAGCSVADWACIRSTSYLYPYSPLTNAQAASFITQGFEVALHPTTQCVDYTSYADLNGYYTSQLASFRQNYPSVPRPATNRMHCLIWSDYDSEPKAELANGIRFDVNYYYWPGSWVNDRPGFFTGSGMPMRFSDRAGTIIDVYQATSQMTDESGQTFPLTINTLLDNAVGPNGFYGVFTANMHTDQVVSAGSNAIVSSAKARGVPVVSSQQMLTWLDGRNGSSFGSFTWSNNALGFTVSPAAGARNLQVMLPMSFRGLALLSLTLGGSAVSYSPDTIKGVSYAVFNGAAGTFQATYR